MAKKETAEQKLLKLIETQEGSEQSGAAPSAQGQETAHQVADSVKGTGLPSLSMPSFLVPLLGLLKMGGTPKTHGFSLGLREVNKLLVSVILVACVFFTLNLISGMKLLKKKTSFDVMTRRTKIPESFFPAFPEIAFYLQTIQKRNIFQPFEKKIEKAKVEKKEEKKVRRIEKMTEKFKLVGVSWLETPESASAMIEDAESGTTYFLKTGEDLRGILVKTIYADRVILQLGSEEVTLRL